MWCFLMITYPILVLEPLHYCLLLNLLLGLEIPLENCFFDPNSACQALAGINGAS